MRSTLLSEHLELEDIHESSLAISSRAMNWEPISEQVDVLAHSQCGAISRCSAVHLKTALVCGIKVI